MTNVRDRILGSYLVFAEFSFYVYLFGTLSFGRAFSVFHINTPFFPLFATEIFLLLNIPLLFYRYKSLIRLPRLLSILLSLFFVFGCFYLGVALFANRMFALRDSAIFVYILLLPITFIHLNTLSKFTHLIWVIIFSNIISLLSCHCILLDIYPSETIRGFLEESKGFNLYFYYGMTSSFIIALYRHVNSKIYRLLALVLLLLNIYTVIISASTSAWLMMLSMLIFLFLMLRRRFLKLLLFFIPIFVITASIMFYIDGKAMPSFYSGRVQGEINSIDLLFHDIFHGKIAINISGNVRAVSKNAPVKICSNPYTASEIAPVSMKTDLEKSAMLGAGNIKWRLDIWGATLRFALQSPLIGKGFGVYPKYVAMAPYQYSPGIYLNANIIPVHNHILTIFFKMGALGLGLFLYANIYVFAYALRYLKRCNMETMKSLLIALLGALVCWHALALLFDVIDSPPTSVFLWIIIGAIFAVVEIDKNSLAAGG